jgi:hypothetical protein
MGVATQWKRIVGVRRTKKLSVSLESILVGEALSAGFYIAVTRGLAPILLAVFGLSIKEILIVSLIAYLNALIATELIKKFRSFVLGSLRRVLLLIHGFERVLWSLLPMTLSLGMLFTISLYSLAITLGTVNGMLINTIIYGLFNENDAKRLITRRTAASATSNVLGQITSVITLALFRGLEKYIILYLLAGSVGLLATLLLTLSRIPDLRLKVAVTSSSKEEEFKAGAVGIYLVALMASMATLAVVWGPYLIKVENAPEYIAASLGLAQMVTSIFSSLFWSRRSFKDYKYALPPLSLIPLLVPLVKEPLLNPLIASVYAFLATGANLLASFILARLSSSLTPLRASARLAESAAIAQILGLGSALLMSALGYWAIFLASLFYISMATTIAFTAIPEVSIVPREYALIYARRLYVTTTATLGFVVVMTRRAAILTLRIIALTLAVLLTLLVYKFLQYLIILS